MKSGKKLRYSEYRQRRRKRLKRMILAFRSFKTFLKHHARHFVIASTFCVILAVLPTAYFSLRPVKAAKTAVGDDDMDIMQSEQETGGVQSRPPNQEAGTESLTESGYAADQDADDILDIETAAGGSETEKYATSHKTDQPVIPADVYAEKNAIAIFKCFYPEASCYIWETFDESIQEWVKAPASDITEQADELLREVSSFIAIASEENDGLMVRCRVDFPDKESCTDTAALHILDNITGISVDDLTTESGQYLSIRDVPVKVTFQDGSEETITGLNGAYFFDTEMKSEESTTVSGNVIETVTTIIESHEYTWIDTGEKEASIRYKNADNLIDIPVKLVGEDRTAPVISQFVVADFEISNVDKPVPVKIMIEASDDITPEKDLLYAFLPEKEEPEETDWKPSPSFETEITQNGIWVAYCRDESGNVATEEKEIIAVDNKAPYVSLQLKNDPESWCQSNTIIVKATDALSIEYRYICAESGGDSGWITQSKYEVEENGTWTVKVKDAVGNIAEEEIAVGNIDKQPPVIQEIKEIEVKKEKEGETASNEN